MMNLHLRHDSLNLHSQFVAVPSAAPLFFMDSELISASFVSLDILRTSDQKRLACRIKPRHTLHADSEKDVVEEEECHTSLRHLRLVLVSREHAVSDEDSDDKVAEALARRSVHEHLSSAPALNIGNTDGREKQVADTVDCGKQACHCVAKAD